MPYIDTATVKQIRDQIKKEFKDCKFSIVCRHYSEVRIAIMESPFEFESDYLQLNHMWIDEGFRDEPEQAKFLKRLVEICHEVQDQVIVSANTDYGDWPNYYISLHVGKWDKPHQTIKRAA